MRSHWLCLLAIIVLAAPIAAAFAEEAADSQPVAEETAADQTAAPAEEGPRPVRILLAEFENDDAFHARKAFRKDFIALIEQRVMTNVTLDTWGEIVQGVSFADGAANARRLGERHGYDVIVWGGGTGLVTTIAVTTVPGPAEGFWRFVNLGVNQVFQFHLDVDFRKLHPMVADAVMGIVNVRIGAYEQALLDFKRSLDYDVNNVFSLNVVRLNLGACHLQRFVENGEADEGRQAIRYFARALDDVKLLDDPVLYGVLKVCLYHTYSRMAVAEPGAAERYRRKAEKSLSNALVVFKEKEYPELYRILAAEQNPPEAGIQPDAR